MSFIINPYSFGAAAIDTYDSASLIYTLRQPTITTLWTNAVLKIRRSSDDATAFVFFDGSTIGDTITLTSLISTSSDTTPSATTLTTWVGANDAFVERWYGITPNNVIDTGKRAIQATTTLQPQFISSGSIITKGGKPSIQFPAATRYLVASALTPLDVGNEFTVLSVNSADSGTGIHVFLSSAPSSSNNRISLYSDRRTQKRIFQLRASSTNYFADYLAQANTTNQKLLTAIKNGTNIISHYNGTIQNTTAWSGTYVNSTLVIGSEGAGVNDLHGYIQEIIIFPSDKTSDLTALHADINSYYSIY